MINFPSPPAFIFPSHVVVRLVSQKPVCLVVTMDTEPLGSIFVRMGSAIAVQLTEQCNFPGSTGSRDRGISLTRMCVVPNYSFRVLTSRESQVAPGHIISSLKED